MEYINRRGETYYAYQGTTKTGKPKYYASKKASSTKARRAEVLPAGFEFSESPMNATVVIRRCKPSVLTIAERNLVSRLALEHCGVQCEVTIDGNSLTVYAGPVARFDPAMEAEMPSLGKRIAEQANFEPGLRFTLVNTDDRNFWAERYCYRSAVDGWLDLPSVPSRLEPIAVKYLKHLGKESFFELG